MLATLIPNYEQELERLRALAPAGFTMAYNITFRGPEYFHSEYPEEWRLRYDAGNYVLVDPVVVWSIRFEGVIRWSAIDFPDVRGVWEGARAHGLNYGAVFSRRLRHKRSVLSVARADREFTDRELEVIGTRFDSWGEMVLGAPELTPGEIEVLRGLKDGFAKHEIAEQLGVSLSAIKHRSMRACAKLSARTATQAVAIAVACNYFER